MLNPYLRPGLLTPCSLASVQLTAKLDVDSGCCYEGATSLLLQSLIPVVDTRSSSAAAAVSPLFDNNDLLSAVCTPSLIQCFAQGAVGPDTSSPPPAPPLLSVSSDPVRLFSFAAPSVGETLDPKGCDFIMEITLFAPTSIVPDGSFGSVPGDAASVQHTFARVVHLYLIRLFLSLIVCKYPQKDTPNTPKISHGKELVYEE